MLSHHGAAHHFFGMCNWKHAMKQCSENSPVVNGAVAKIVSRCRPFSVSLQIRLAQTNCLGIAVNGVNQNLHQVDKFVVNIRSRCTETT